jgi:hypothetical protein
MKSKKPVSANPKPENIITAKFKIRGTARLCIVRLNRCRCNRPYHPISAA